MKNFSFFAPTKVIFGKDTHKQCGEVLKTYQAKKVLVHYGGGSAKKSGVLDEVTQSLSEAGVDFVLLGGVVPNPRLSKVYEGIALCQKENVDFILAIGGGSVIDSAKAISYGVANPQYDVWDFYSGKATASAFMPIGAILTIAAAGSEMSNSSVITKEEGWLKRGYRNDICRCKFAILNPSLTCTLSSYQTASGCVDIMMHTMERFFTSEIPLEITDQIGLGLMKTVLKHAKILAKDPNCYASRAEVMWASSLSHNDLTGCSSDGGDWAVHQLQHELGGMFDIAHGAGLAAIWGSWARYVYKENPARFAQFANEIFGIEDAPEGDEQTALLGIEAMEDFYHSIHMPTSLHEMNIFPTDEQIEQLAYKCSFMDKRTIGSFKKLDRNDMKEIYKLAR